jgi:hypothetical protein
MGIVAEACATEAAAGADLLSADCCGCGRLTLRLRFAKLVLSFAATAGWKRV